MTAAEVERLAREAGLHRAGNLWYSLETGSNRENADVAHDDLARFAALVQAAELMKSADEIDAAVAAERERCAKVCESRATTAEDSGVYHELLLTAAAIRED